MTIVTLAASQPPRRPALVVESESGVPAEAVRNMHVRSVRYWLCGVVMCALVEIVTVVLNATLPHVRHCNGLSSLADP